jgi:hypothetical protein
MHFRFSSKHTGNFLSWRAGIHPKMGRRRTHHTFLTAATATGRQYKVEMADEQYGILKLTVYILFPIHLDQFFDPTMLFEAKNELL